MADTLLKISDTTKTPDACKAADDDGLLVTILLEALTATNRLDIGAHGRTTYSPTNYSSAGQSLDEHLTGIDSVLAGVGAAHALGGSQHSVDTLANLNSKVTGGDLDFNTASRSPSGSATGDLTSSYPNPQVAKIRGYAVQAHAPLDGEVLKWVNANSQYEPASPGGAPEAHLLGGTSHTADSLANLNSKVTGGSLDFTTASRPPNGSASGDLSGTYPGPTVSKIAGYIVQTGAPTTKDILQWSGAQWAHVTGLAPHYDSGWFSVTYNGSYAKTHGLGVLPRQVQVFVSPNANGNPCHLAGWAWNYAVSSGDGRGTIVCDITTTTLSVRTGTASASGVTDTYLVGGTRRQLAAGSYARVMCWK